MSLTICAWIRQIAISSGRIVSQPSGPGGKASEPAVSAARWAARLPSWRACARGSGPPATLLAGIWLTKSRIAWVTRLDSTGAITAGTCLLDSAIGVLPVRGGGMGRV